jgi:thymidylate synthase (FAD)
MSTSIRPGTPSSKTGSTAPPWKASADVATAEDFLKYLETTEAHYADYERMLDKGIARELARIGLPLSVYTEWYWKIDLHNLFHFLSLRMDPHAQQEIRDYANAMFALIQPIVPIAAEAFLDYRLHAMTLSRLEVEALRSEKPLATENKREVEEWEEKRKRLGLG